MIAIGIDAAAERFAASHEGSVVVRVFQLTTGLCTHSCRNNHMSIVQSVSFCGDALFTGSNDSVIRMWSLATRLDKLSTAAATPAADASTAAPLLASTNVHRHNVLGMVALKDGSLVSVDEDEKLYILRHTEDPEHLVKLLSHETADVRNRAATALCDSRKLGDQKLAPIIKPILALLAEDSGGVPPSVPEGDLPSKGVYDAAQDPTSSEYTLARNTEARERPAAATSMTPEKAERPAAATASSYPTARPMAARPVAVPFRPVAVPFRPVAARPGSYSSPSGAEMIPALKVLSRMSGQTGSFVGHPQGRSLAIPELMEHSAQVVELLAHKMVAVREGALRALQGMQRRDAVHLQGYKETMLKVLDEVSGSRDDMSVVKSVLDALKLAGLSEEETIVLIQQLLRSDKMPTRATALRELASTSSAALVENIDSIITHVGHADKAVSSAAYIALEKVGDAECLAKHTSKLVEYLQHANPSVQVYATRTLDKIDLAHVVPHTAALIDKLDDREPLNEVSRRITGRLDKFDSSSLTPHAASIASKLSVPATPANAAIRSWATRTVGRLEPSALAAHAHVLVATLDDSAPAMRIDALTALAKLQPEALSMHAANIAAKVHGTNKDPQPRVRLAALEALERLNQPALALHSVMLLSVIAEDIDRSVRMKAKGTLAKIKPDDVAPHAATFAGKLTDKDAKERSKALEMLQCFAAGALATHITAIAATLADQEESVRLEGMRTLLQLEPALLAPHVAAIAAILEAAATKDLRKATLTTMSKLEAAVLEPYASLLVTHLGPSHDSNVVNAALATIAKLEPSSIILHQKEVADKLTSDDSRVRKGAAAVLGVLPAEVVANYVAELVVKLKPSNPYNQSQGQEIRIEALDQLSHFLPTALRPHAEAVAARLDDSQPPVRQAAVKTLAKFDVMALTPHLATFSALLSNSDKTRHLLGLQALRIAGQTNDELKSALLTSRECATLQELKDKGGSAAELIAAGWSSDELKAVGIEHREGSGQWSSSHSLFNMHPLEGFGLPAGEFQVGQLCQIYSERYDTMWRYGKIMSFDSKNEVYSVMTREGPSHSVPRERLTDDIVTNPEDGSCAQQ